jgi:gas vesicle protein
LRFSWKNASTTRRTNGTDLAFHLSGPERFRQIAPILGDKHPLRRINVDHEGECNMADMKHKTEHMASDAADKARQTASSVSERAQDLASSASEMASNAGKRISDTVSHLAENIQSTAGDLRQRVPQAVAEGMDSAGRYLQEEGFSGIAEDLTTLIRRNPIPALFVGIGIGFLLARITRS